MTILFGTGFETGMIAHGNYRGGTYALATAQKRTGTYSLSLTLNGYYEWSMNNSELYISVAFYQPSASTASTGFVEFRLSDGTTVSLRFASQSMNAYRDTTLIAAGTTYLYDQWNHLQVHVSIDNSSGVFQTKLNGVADIDFSGDTQPNTSTTIVYCGVKISNNPVIYWDDIVIGTGGWLGDMRFEVLVPNGDTVDEDWDLSTGSDSFALLDEIPPSDGDYIYTAANAQKTLLTLGDWDATGKDPQAVIIWARAQKEAATSDQIKLVALSDTTEDASDAMDIDSGSPSELFYVMEQDPDTSSPWEDAGIDALKVGVESVIS